MKHQTYEGAAKPFYGVCIGIMGDKEHLHLRSLRPGFLEVSIARLSTMVTVYKYLMEINMSLVLLYTPHGSFVLSFPLALTTLKAPSFAFVLPARCRIAPLPFTGLYVDGPILT